MLVGDHQRSERLGVNQGKPPVELTCKHSLSLIVCALLLSGGLAQLRRVSSRGWRPWRRWAAPSSVAFEDGHDNNFLLLELALALPFALGWRVPQVTRMLAGTLFAEAAVCWPVWRHWPNP